MNSPFEHLSADIFEQGRRMFARPANFVTSVYHLKDLPDGDRVEVCFAGRSNVGKSSLLNALTHQKNLAKTSNTPGRTQCLNFFNIDEGQGYLVDVPGYGYAKASKSVIEQWNKVLNAYLLGRATLKRIFLLIDTRHGIKANDREMMNTFDKCGVNYQVVLTKADKVGGQTCRDTLEKIKVAVAKHGAAHPIVHMTSSSTGEGIDAVRAEIAALL